MGFEEEAGDRDELFQDDRYEFHPAGGGHP